MDQHQQQYDPNVIIQSANDKLRGGDLEGAQMVFQSALLTWVDDAREQQQQQQTGGGTTTETTTTTTTDIESLNEAIATLWIAYAHFLANAKQFKSSTEAYEQAVSCPVASRHGRVWLDYARFAEDRGRVKTAQDIYLRALVGKKGEVPPPSITDEQDLNLLWNEFLEMMRKANPDLTLDALKKAVAAAESGSCTINESTNAAAAAAAAVAVPSAVVSSSSGAVDPRRSGAATPPANKRMRLSPPPTTGAGAIKAEEAEDEQGNKTHVVTDESVEIEASAFSDILLSNMNKSVPPVILAGWMVRDGHDLPTPPDPPLFEPSPPKLADPTAKDILGTPLALELIQRLANSEYGNLTLEVCQGLWALQAVKEKQTQTDIDQFDEAIKKELDKFESNLQARLDALAGKDSYDKVKQLNDVERKNFRNALNQQRQNLVSKNAWEMRQLLCVQQQILTKLAVPGFVDVGGPTVDAATLDLQARICSYLHSAFYLRNRIGEKPHVAMLKNQVKRLEKEIETGRSTSASPVPQPPAAAVGRLSPNVPTPPRSPYTPSSGGGMVVPMMSQQPLPQIPQPLPQQPAFAYGQQQQQQQQPVQVHYQPQPPMMASNTAAAALAGIAPQLLQHQQHLPTMNYGGVGGGFPQQQIPGQQQQQQLPPHLLLAAQQQQQLNLQQQQMGGVYQQQQQQPPQQQQQPQYPPYNYQR